MKKLVIMICSVLVLISGCAVPNGSKAKLASLDALCEHEAILSAEAVTDLDGYFDDKAIAYRIRYESDSCEVIGFVGAPIDYLERQYPILIYNRGGNRGFGKLWPVESAYYASLGYIVLASQYRGVDGGTGREQFGGDEINDVLKLVDISEDFAFARAAGCIWQAIRAAA